MAPKKLYAHATIEHPGPGAQPRIQPGQQVPRDLDGLDELLDGGAVKGSPPKADRDVRAGDGATVSQRSG